MKNTITVNEFLNSKGIIINKKNNISLNSLDEKEIKKQIILIKKTHELLLGGSKEPYLRLLNTVGKSEEGFKLLLKRFIRLIDNLKREGVKNEFENHIMLISDKVVYRAEKALAGIYTENYEKMILRSMRKGEVIVYYTDNNCLYENESNIVLCKEKGVSYNIEEIDYARYFSKIRKYISEKCYNNMLDYYMDLNNKSVVSKDYINSYVEFPNEIIKVLFRYYERRDMENFNRYLSKIKESNI